MSLQWTLVAGFLYAEIALLVLILLPFISDRFWNTILRISFIKKLERQFSYYFYCVVTILGKLLKYSSIEDIAKEAIVQKLRSKKILIFQHGMRTLQLEMQQQTRIFRAQRSFYIVGLLSSF